MKMKRCTAAILLVLSLGALVAGRISAAVADDGVDTIRLPSNGLTGESVTAGEKKRPWGKCCDNTFCNRRMPPGCRCMDAVDRCDDACRRCEVHPSDPSKHICMDSYIGLPGPNCTHPGDDFPSDHEATAAVAAAATEPAPRPCCDLPRCTRSFPPTCQCMDKMNKCPKTCKLCEKNDASSLIVCLDSYVGMPPKCTNSVVNGHEATAAVAVAATKERPWKCCDLPRCTRSFPPTCHCMDKMNKCPKTCKLCEKDEASSLIVCLDSYVGMPGPMCTKSVAGSGNILPAEHVSGRCRWPVCSGDNDDGHLLAGPGVVAGQEATADADAVSEKSVAVGEEAARPWKCCDDTLCTRSAPPTCFCRDKVKKCAKTCKLCEKADEANGASSRYVCRDSYFGWPGPKCSSS